MNQFGKTIDNLNVLSSKPIFGFLRGNTLEVLVQGFYGMIINGDTVTPQTLPFKFVSRSLLKPWQFLACGIEEDSDLWAMGLSSSSGQPIHVEALKKLSSETGIDISELVCPEVYPYDFNETAKLIVTGSPKSRLYHFCCGKHLLMKYACKKIGSNPDTYYRPENKLQKKIFELIDSITKEKKLWHIDSCGVPTLCCSMKGHLDIWNSLCNAKDNNIGVIRSIWSANPDIIGGTNRLDSTIIKISSGKVLAKEGADGLLALLFFDDKKYEKFILILKLTQSVPDSYLGLALMSVLLRYSEKLPEALHLVLHYLRNRMTDWVRSDQEYIAF